MIDTERGVSGERRYSSEVLPECESYLRTFETGSTKPELRVEICSKCHPFFTGQQRAQQARGRIEQFNKRYGKTAK